MSEVLSAARPDFFGKDSFCPFIAQVEDVNDPNKSGRVKIRCVGWHHYNRGETAAGGSGEDALPTADLPWARVGMPTTHAQQSRIGGKHGLQVGSWVMGFFVDGEEAQDPFVLCTFNHTARTSEVNNRKDVFGTTGTMSNEARGFTKGVAAPAVTPNTSRSTTEEPGGNGGDSVDPSEDTVCIDSIDDFGGTLISAQVAERIKSKYANDHPSSQDVEVTVADGRCGRVQHSKTDVQKVIQESLPSATTRFTYGDKVWELTTGNSINLNGTLMQMGQQISGFLKQPINAKKGRLEDETNRPERAKALTVSDRDGNLTIAIDIEKAFEVDEIAAVFQESSINGLAAIILSLLQMMDNNGVETVGENLTGIIGAGPSTNISNNAAACLADSLLESIDAITDVALVDAAVAVKAIIDALKGGDGIKSFLKGLKAATKLTNSLRVGNPIDDFNTVEKFSENQDVFHGAGDRTKDLRQLACQVERIYQTAEGYLAGIASVGGGTGGFGEVPGLGALFAGGAGKGFGGISILANSVVNVIPCEDALTQFFPDDYDDPRFPDPNNDGGYGDDLIDGGNDINRPTSITGIDITGPRVVQVKRRAKFVADVSMGDESYNVYNKYYWSVFPEEPLITNASREEMSSDITVKFSNKGKYTLKVRVENDRAKNAPVTKTFRVEVRSKNRMSDEEIIPGINTYPAGKFAIIKAISEPSSDPEAANNFIRGVPNSTVIINPGKQYYFRNQANPKNVYPSTFIRGYAGTPIPVIDQHTGEYVALLTSPVSWDDNYPKVPITVIPDNNDVGILSQDPDFDIELGGFYIQNTGRGYHVPTINIIDKDTGLKNGEVEPVVVDGRIVDLKIKNSGTNFKRIPQIEIVDNGKSKLLIELESELERRGLASNIRQKGDKPK